jgi:hypothetical protein
VFRMVDDGTDDDFDATTAMGAKAEEVVVQD